MNNLKKRLVAWCVMIVLTMSMTLVVNASYYDGSYNGGTYHASLTYTAGTSYVYTSLTAYPSDEDADLSISLSGSSYSSTEGISDSLYASGWDFCSDRSYAGAWTSATCNYYINGSYVKNLSL